MGPMRALYLAGLAAGCGSSAERACLAYADAYRACATEATGAEVKLEVSCHGADGLDGEAAKAAVRQWRCLADAYAGADCGSIEAFEALGALGRPGGDCVGMPQQ
jgi:hypothetical protein